MTEDEMAGWHHRLDGHEFEQALGVGDGQRSLAWRILSVILLACEMSAIVRCLNILWHCLSLGLE